MAYIFDELQDVERKILRETTKKMNEYVRFLVRNGKREKAEEFCEEKYARIATTGFLKKLLAYFIERDENNEAIASTDLTSVFEFVNEKLPGRVEMVKEPSNSEPQNNSINEDDDTYEKNGTNDNNSTNENNVIDEYLSINVEEGVTLKLQIIDSKTLAVMVCVPPPDSWSLSFKRKEMEAQPDNGPKMPEPDGKEENAPLKYPVSKLGAFCKAAEHIYKNAHHLNEWPKISCWRLPEKYMYLDYPKKDVFEKVPDIWWDDWLEAASDEDRSDMELVKKLISKRGECLKYASRELKSNRKIVIKAIKSNSYAINYASEELQNDREFIIENVKKNGRLFEDIKEKFREDKEIALIAVKKCSGNYDILSERLKKDRDIIEIVVADDVYRFCHAPEEILKDKKLAMRIVSERGDMLRYLPECMRADKDIVLTAVTAKAACYPEDYGRDGIALGYALGGLNNDREVVTAAIGYFGFALECASDELKDDREIVRMAIENYGRALGCSSERLRDDRELVIEAIKRDGTAFCFASERLRSDREIIKMAIQSSGIEVFHAFPEELTGKLDFKIFMLESISQCLPKFDDYGEFGDGTSEYYGIFEDYEEAFSDIVKEIPIELLKERPELVDKIWKLAVTVDMDYYDEGSNPYEDSHERLPDTLKEFFAEHGIFYSPHP